MRKQNGILSYVCPQKEKKEKKRRRYFDMVGWSNVIKTKKKKQKSLQ